MTATAPAGTAPGADLLALLRAEVGATGDPLVARHPIGATAVADWCDVIGDAHTAYTDEAPPATLDIWNRPGLPATRGRSTRDDPRNRVLAALDAAGCTSIVAVTAELELARYPRIGDLLSDVQTLEDVTAEKATALGAGHFVTTRHRYTDQDGGHVGDLLFRVLKFRPGTGREPAPGDAPDPDPALRPAPAENRDNAFLFDGYRAHELRIPSCRRCGALTFPPTPRCVACGSFDRGWVVSAGRGTLHSYAVPHHPRPPGFRYPLPVGLIDLAEGTRLLADLTGVRRDQLAVGMPLELHWLDRGPGLVPLPQFRPATSARRTQARTEAATGDRLPAWGLPVTPTLIVSGALATRDFTPVHHDRALAVAQGSADIFLNINTSVGLLQRYVTDWAGPGARVTALRVRLGAPAYPGDPLAFDGQVQAADGRCLTVAATMTNALGAHVTGTVELELPA